MNERLSRLRDPFGENDIEWVPISKPYEGRQGRRVRVAPYVTARAVQQRLDDVLGPEHWSTRYAEISGGVICELSVRCGDDWVVKSDGAGQTKYEAVKGGLSGAFKRAAVQWGIGRYLYGWDHPWVPCDEHGHPTEWPSPVDAAPASVLPSDRKAPPTQPDQSRAEPTQADQSRTRPQRTEKEREGRSGSRGSESQSAGGATRRQTGLLLQAGRERGYTREDWQRTLEPYAVDIIYDLTESQAAELIEWFGRDGDRPVGRGVPNPIRTGQ